MPRVKKRKERVKKARPNKKSRSKCMFFLVFTITILAFVISFFLYTTYRTAKSNNMKKISIDLYFADSSSKTLLRERRDVASSEFIHSQAKQVILELIKGPNTDLTSTIPPGTVLRDLFVNADHTAYVDFSSELISGHSGGSSAELLTIYSIVDSLILNFDEIDRVQILVEGEKVTTIAGHIFAERPFDVNLEIVGE